MNRSFTVRTVALALAMIVSPLLLPALAHADLPSGIGQLQQQVNQAAAISQGDSGAQAVQDTSAATPAPPAPPAGQLKTGDCELVTGSNGMCPIAYVLAVLMKLFAYLLGIAGIALNDAVVYTVLQMGTFVHQIAGLGVAWGVFRDVGNIVLVFGFLAIGISTILNAKWYGGGTKMLPILLLAAVFLNFSLFISEGVIDVGNLFAVQIYTQINGGKTPSAEIVTSAGQEGISNTIMNAVSLQQFYNFDSGTASAGQIAFQFKDDSLQYVEFLAVILFLIAAFVMFSLAFMLIARFVFLIFLMVVAPVGFAGLAVPRLENTAKKWWKNLFEQTIIAPILLLLLYVALAVITDKGFINLSGSKAAGGLSGVITDPTPANIQALAGTVLTFLIGMGLLMACVIIAKNMGAYGASWATKSAGWLSFGVAGFAGRQTVGRVSTWAGRGFRKIPGVGDTEAGRQFAKLFEYGGKASFDLRGAGGFKVSGVDAGQAQKGGRLADEKATIAAREEYAKSLRPGYFDRAKKKSAEDKKEREEKSYDKEVLATEAAQRAARQPLDEEVKRKRELVAQAKASGDAKALATEETSLNNSLRELEELRKKQLESRKKLDEAHKSAVKDLEDQIKAAEQGPQRKYARDLDWGIWPYKGYTESESARLIRKRLDMSDADLLSSELRSALERSRKEGSEPKTEQPKTTT